MKLQTEIVVEPKEGFCTWKIDASRLAYDATLVVGMGCEVLYLVNGALSNLFDAGRYRINPRADRRDNNSISLIGVNRGKIFNLIWGVGEIPFRDKEIRAETVIGMNGEYAIQIYKPVKLYTAFGKADITPMEIVVKMRPKLTEMLKSQLAGQLKNYSYLDVQSKQSEISDTVRKTFDKELEEYGIGLKSFALKEIVFPDDFKQARREKQAREDEYDDMLRREDEEKRHRLDQLREAKAMEEFISKLSPSEPQAAQTKCPVCGAACVSGAVFCPKCGKKL